MLVWTDVFGVIIRLDISLQGSSHDRFLYTMSEVFQSPSEFFSNGQVAMADMGFQGEGNLVYPFKRNQGRDFTFRREFNRDIRSQRIRNEWSIGLVSNRFRQFLGRWSLDESLFIQTYTVACHLVNFRIRSSGRPPVPIERMLERLELYLSLIHI